MKKMSLLEKYQKGLLKEGDYIPNFKPDQGTITITKKETGWTGNQIVSTENLRYQFAGIIGNKAILLSDTVTKKKIYLGGRKGYRRGPKTLKKVLGKCYSSEQFEAKGFILSEDIFEKLPKVFKKIGINQYWLNTKWYKKYPFSNSKEWGLCYADDIVHRTVLIKTFGWKYASSNGIRPAVYLPTETLLDEKNNIVFGEQK